jgi:hypothetical protein
LHLNCNNKDIGQNHRPEINRQRINMTDILELENHLKDNLEFPFLAEVCEYQESDILNEGDKVKVFGIQGNEDLYGLIVKVKLGRKTYHFPLYDLSAVDKKSDNHKLIEEYKKAFEKLFNSIFEKGK